MFRGMCKYCVPDCGCQGAEPDLQYELQLRRRWKMKLMKRHVRGAPRRTERAHVQGYDTLQGMYDAAGNPTPLSSSDCGIR